MTLDIVLVLGAVLVALGLGTAWRRRSLIGFVIGIELAVGGVALIALALFDLTGSETSTGAVIAMAVITLGVGAAVVIAALELWARRAGRRVADLEPW